MSKILVFFMAANMVATPTYAITKSSCQLYMSDWINDEDAEESPFKNVEFKVYSKKQKKDKHETPIGAGSILGNNDFAIGFNRDGSIKLYFGDKEALFDKVSDLSFQVLPVDHSMELGDHDVVVIYRDIRRSDRERIGAIFEVDSDEVNQVPGYNCVDLACRVLELSNGDRVAGGIFQSEEMFLALLNRKAAFYGGIEVWVVDEVKTPRRFHEMLQNEKNHDQFTALDSVGEFTFQLSVMLTLTGGGLFGLWQFLEWLYSY